MKFSPEEHGFMVQTTTAQQLKECQDHSERLRLLSHQRSEYFKKKKEEAQLKIEETVRKENMRKFFI